MTKSSVRAICIPAIAATCLVLGIACDTKSVRNSPVNVARGDGGADGPGNPIDPDRGQCRAEDAPRAAPGEECACNGDCSSGTCSEGVCCDAEACGGKRALGAACMDGSQCDSEICADGVCCNVSCTGACVSCSLPEERGQCSPVPAGEKDPHQACRSDDPETCGQSGFCNGQGACAKYSAGTICQLGGCEGKDSFLPAGTCDGEGICQTGLPVACAPSTCEAGACLTSCTADGQCSAGVTCKGGSCGLRGDGQDCTSAEQCQSGKCVDGVCCNSDCTGSCQTCALPNARGKCSPAPAGAGDPRGICKDEGAAGCGTNGKCDGRSGCQRYPDGTLCRASSCDGSSNAELPAGSCQEGLCMAPGPRSCAPYRGCSGNVCASTCGSNSQCSEGLCARGSCGKRADGASCSKAGDCASNVCAQGRCCSGPCGGTCRSCNVPGKEGTCSNVPSGGNDPAGECRNDACSNGCDGGGGCRREASGTSCGGASCSGNTRVQRVCNAEGMCQTRNNDCGGGTPLCEDGRCRAPAPPACTAANCPGPCKVCVGDRCVNAGGGTGCPGGMCAGGSCVPSCSAATCSGNRAECRGGACVGTCAAGNCEGPCRACSGNNRACNVRPNGSACPGGTCDDGTCRPRPTCPASCTGPCRSCNMETGTCTMTAPGGRCPGGTCNAAGACIPTPPPPMCTPATCVGNRAECRGADCVGTCNAMNCAGPCRSCSGNNRACNVRMNGACQTGNGPGMCNAAGNCVANPPPPPPPPGCTPATCMGNRAECRGADCVGTCNAMNCAGPCRSCSGNNRACNVRTNGACQTGSGPGMCNAAGNCVANPPPPPPPPGCTPATCVGNRAVCRGADCVGTCNAMNCAGPCRSCSGNNRACNVRTNGACQTGSGPGMCNAAGNCVANPPPPSPPPPMTCQGCGPCQECNPANGRCRNKPPLTPCPGGVCVGGMCRMRGTPMPPRPGPGPGPTTPTAPATQ